MPLVVEQTMQDNDPSKLSAIAVPLGPGEKDATKVGIDYATALGKKFQVPVIPINLIEAQVFTARLKNANIPFPYLSVTTTGIQTEIVLTRGVGLHTVMGMSIDMGA